MKQTEKIYEYPSWLNRKEYPFSTKFYQTPVGKINYVDEGVGDPIVFVHGNPGWSFEFRIIIKEMIKTNRCLAIDHLGFGLSDKPSTYGYLPKDHALNFENWLESLGLSNMTLVVNDWGGPIGLSYALKYPDKIKKIIVLNSWLWNVEDDPHFRNFSKFMGGPIGKFLIRYFNFFGKQVVKRAMGDHTKIPTNILNHYHHHLQTPDDRKGCYIFPRQILESGPWLNSLWEQRAKINTIPTTFVWGMKDIAFREQDLNFWLKNWKNSSVIKLQKVGHFPQEESPEEVIRALKNE